MITTPNMGLTAWDQGSDIYSHIQLAQNFEAIDQHDHTPGKGVRIPTAGIADGAITTAKLADGAVTNAKLANNAVDSSKILDGSITGVDIAPGTITLTNLAADVLALVPTGAVIPYAAASPPTGWLVCDGSAVSRTTYAALFALFTTIYGVGNGTTTFNLPDLQTRIPVGKGLSGATILGQNEGTLANSRVLTHSHTVNAHSHTVNAHSHAVNSHSHTITNDGDHFHQWPDNGSVLESLSTRRLTTAIGEPDLAVATDGVSGLEALFIPNFTTPNASASRNEAMNTLGTHNHTGATGSTSTSTDSQSPGTSSVAPGTNTAIPLPYLTLNFIIKI